MPDTTYIFVIEWKNRYNQWVAIDFEYHSREAVKRKKELKAIDMKQIYRIKKYVPEFKLKY